MTVKDIQLEQILINRCNNAYDPMEQSEEQILNIQSLSKVDEMVARVSGTETGMLPEVRE